MKVLNRHHLKSLAPDQIYIGRGSIFGNPFSLDLFRKDRELLLSFYRQWFLFQVSNNTEMVKELWKIPMGSSLVCYCHPRECHGHVMAEFRHETQQFSTLKEARKYYLEKHNYQSLPTLEGKTHINIYSKSLTDLGKLASNFAYTPFTHPTMGRFDSMEGYWFYVGTGCEHDHLRTLYGNQAKIVGSSHPKVMRVDFEELIKEGLACKVEQTPELQRLLKENVLPFKHYYFYGSPENCKVVFEGNGLLEKTYQALSTKLGGRSKTIIAGSRTIKDWISMTDAVLESKIGISEIVEGGANGVDTFGYIYALQNHIPVKSFHVSDEEWKASKGAGHIRNAKMGDYADKGIVMIKDHSKGSTHMANYLKSKQKEVYVKEFK